MQNLKVLHSLAAAELAAADKEKKEKKEVFLGFCCGFFRFDQLGPVHSPLGGGWKWWWATPVAPRFLNGPRIQGTWTRIQKSNSETRRSSNSLMRRSQRPLWFKNCWRCRQQVFLQQNVHSIPSPRHDSLFYQVGDCWQKLTALAA
jgi:hypothetical protein